MFVPAMRYGSPPRVKRIPLLRTNGPRRGELKAEAPASNADPPTSMSRRVIDATIGISPFSWRLFHQHAAAQGSATKNAIGAPQRGLANLLLRSNGYG